MKVTVKSWLAVAVWRWVTNDNIECGICRLPFDGCCPDCRIPGDDCPLGTQCMKVLSKEVRFNYEPLAISFGDGSYITFLILYSEGRL